MGGTQNRRVTLQADPSMDAVGSPLTPDRGRDRRWSVTKESGLSASERRCPLRGRRRLEIREERRRTMGPLWAADRVEPKPPRARSSSKTEFAISPEEREVTTMNVCTAGGSQGNAAPPLKMAEKIAFAFAAPSLPPTSKKHASSSWRRTEDVGTVIKFPSLPRGPRAQSGEGSAFALQNEAARLNGLFFQLPFRPRAESEWSVVQCARANMHSTCARCGDSR